MTTNNALNLNLSGTTGTGNFAGDNAPTLIAPILGDSTLTSISFNPTINGLVGTTAGDNATSGLVGEVISAGPTTSSNLTSGTPANITSITLSAGDWDVYGFMQTNPASGTTTSIFLSSLSTASATQGSFPTNPGAYIASQSAAMPLVTTRINVSGNTTVYAVATITFSVSTMTCTSTIYARRAR